MYVVNGLFNYIFLSSDSAGLLGLLRLHGLLTGQKIGAVGIG
jgi:hypothetical protein